MRVISGTAKGKRLHPPADRSVRPTGDRVKEALFSILYSMLGPLDDMKVLDLYAGSGALGIEALSRGAAECLFVDMSPASCRLIQKNLQSTGLQACTKIWCKSVVKALVQLESSVTAFNLVFMDPPYGREDTNSILQTLGNGSLLSQAATIVLESSSTESLPVHHEHLTLLDRRTYGATALCFFRYTVPN